VKVKTELRHGAAWREIDQAAADLKVDLIVLGTHGRKGIARALLGSVAEKVVRTAACPVLTVRGGEAAH
jgi:nucleotide-binding universal stress UspA family protein